MSKIKNEKGINMKTNQIMVREQKGFIQRTNDEYFSATKLIEYYNTNHKPKQLGKYRINNSTKAFIKQLQSEGIEEPVITGRGTGENSGTWMHPKLFVDFAMWVSVEFKSIVIDYVLDGLIKSRHDAGDYYKEMTVAILDSYVEFYNKKPSPFVYAAEAAMIKDVAGIEKDRNELTEKELNILTNLQKVNSVLITSKVGKKSRKRQLEIVATGLKK